jgi:hypothetical protein
MVDGKLYASRHVATPFGATSSVYAWHRVGAMIQHIAIALLRIPILRYVDDFFAVERAELAEHSMQCFARLVRILFGDDVVQEKKLQHGNPLTILGLRVSADDKQAVAWPDEEKTVKWVAQIDRALDANKLHPVEAAKMAGRLNFAVQHAFLRIGKAAIVPVYRQQHDPLRGNRISAVLREALEWWKKFLRNPTRAVTKYDETVRHVHIFTDARSTPPRLAAVMLVDGKLSFTDAPPTPEVIEQLLKRDDQQIMALEMIAAYFGLSSFAEEVRDAVIHLWVDNTSGEAALRNGSSKRIDHNAICHQTRLFAASLNSTICLHRVPSALNISDLPSREVYAALLAYSATRVPPVQPPFTDFNAFALPMPDEPPPTPPPPATQSRRNHLRSRADAKLRK